MKIHNDGKTHELLVGLANTAPQSLFGGSSKRIKEAINQIKGSALDTLDIDEAHLPQIIGSITKGHEQRVKLIKWLKEHDPKDYDVIDAKVLKAIKEEVDKKLLTQPVFSKNRKEELNEINKLLASQLEKSAPLDIKMDELTSKLISKVLGDTPFTLVNAKELLERLENPQNIQRKRRDPILEIANAILDRQIPGITTKELKRVIENPYKPLETEAHKIESDFESQRRPLNLQVDAQTKQVMQQIFSAPFTLQDAKQVLTLLEEPWQAKEDSNPHQQLANAIARNQIGITKDDLRQAMVSPNTQFRTIAAANELEHRTNIIINSFTDTDYKIEGFGRLSASKPQVAEALDKFVKPGANTKKVAEDVKDPLIRLGMLKQLWSNPPDEIGRILNKPELTKDDIQRLGSDFNALIKLLRKISAFQGDNKMGASNLAKVFAAPFAKHPDELKNIINNLQKLIESTYSKVPADLQKPKKEKKAAKKL